MKASIAHSRADRARIRRPGTEALVTFLVVILLSAGTARAVLFQDITSDAGLNYVYIPDNHYSYAPGAAFGDWDNDGDVDLYITRDSQGDLLFMNDGSGNFSNVSAEYILEPNPGSGTGVAWGDFDRDGDLDLFVANGQLENVLYKNLLIETGVPSLQNQTGQFNVRETQVRASMGVSLVDFNLDGRLDIYVANYVQEPNYLYQMRPDGFFVDMASYWGLDNRGWGFVSIWTDCDVDGDMDVYLVNDFSFKFEPNVLFRNMKKETGSPNFVDITPTCGDLANDRGMGMGVAVGDCNKDGLLDIYVTNYYSNNLYQNNGDGTYDEVAQQANVDDDEIGWGTAFCDYDNDRDLDLLLVNGYITGKAKPYGPHPDILYRNSGLGSFSDYSTNVGFDSDLQARALALGDIDMDGDMDALVTCCNALGEPVYPILYRNDGGNTKSWLGIRLFGVASNLQGIGSRIEVVAGGETMVQEIHAGSSFLAQHTTWPIFGLGSSARATSVTVRWPSGTVDRLDNIPGRQYISIVEGLGLVAVSLQSYQAEYRGGAVEVAWEVRHDGEIAGFSLDRRRSDHTDFMTLAGPDELPVGLADRHVYTDGGVLPGFTYEYRLRAHYQDGRIEVLANRSVEIPKGDVVLEQNVPNPFNPMTTIPYELAEAGRVELAVYDVAGRRVRGLVSRFEEPGMHRAIWDGRDEAGMPVPSGVYYYRLEIGKTVLGRKMVLMK